MRDVIVGFDLLQHAINVHRVPEPLVEVTRGGQGRQPSKTRRRARKAELVDRCAQAFGLAGGDPTSVPASAVASCSSIAVTTVSIASRPIQLRPLLGSQLRREDLWGRHGDTVSAGAEAAGGAVESGEAVGAVKGIAADGGTLEGFGQGRAWRGPGAGAGAGAALFAMMKPGRAGRGIGFLLGHGDGKVWCARGGGQRRDVSSEICPGSFYVGKGEAR